ncbi:type II toxin-antitoxin system death-on-curing family toxin [Segniliparus rugosus]|uniref:Fido domain-containing protein n=1 Tax=Segniliparus rugosus (strain ATCC BAA-974 / DSM 45345 / CCUG 50838 / CIP 108380 / JCM 13579 / CDC 945) TaxID=679197 RepID=E5XLB1_SEGRC|nr:Fic family protein [Segniliparus rugosus]EFV14861.1 hypothetical protein HMPREF9336_00280 [Segniliparus rugosus ATCC BAA-974]
MADTSETRYLVLEDLLAICEEVGNLQVADLGLLDAACARPRSSVFGMDAYPDLVTKTAALLQSIVRNRALVDGNKRLSWLSAYAFLAINGHDLDAPEDDAYDLVIGAAAGALDLMEIAAALRAWVVPAE